MTALHISFGWSGDQPRSPYDLPPSVGPHFPQGAGSAPVIREQPNYPATELLVAATGVPPLGRTDES